MFAYAEGDTIAYYASRGDAKKAYLLNYTKFCAIRIDQWHRPMAYGIVNRNFVHEVSIINWRPTDTFPSTVERSCENDNGARFKEFFNQFQEFNKFLLTQLP